MIITFILNYYSIIIFLIKFTQFKFIFNFIFPLIFRILLTIYFIMKLIPKLLNLFNSKQISFLIIIGVTFITHFLF